jgi:hypothetical protein
MAQTFAAMGQVADPEAGEDVPDLFMRAELEGHLARAPEDWPLSKRSKSPTPHVAEEASDPVLQGLIEAGVVDEAVLLRRDGSVVSHAGVTGFRTDEDPSDETPRTEGSCAPRTEGSCAPRTEGSCAPRTEGSCAASGILEVVRCVSRSVFPRAREFDMGRFRRCTIQGRFGNVVVGRVGDVLVGIRGPVSDEPGRMWDRVAQELEATARRGAA